MAIQKISFLQNFVSCVTGHLHGERNGKKIGMPLNIAAISAG